MEDEGGVGGVEGEGEKRTLRMQFDCVVVVKRNDAAEGEEERRRGAAAEDSGQAKMTVRRSTGRKRPFRRRALNDRTTATTTRRTEVKVSAREARKSRCEVEKKEKLRPRRRRVVPFHRRASSVNCTRSYRCGSVDEAPGGQGEWRSRKGKKRCVRGEKVE